MNMIRKAELWLATGFYLLVIFAILYPALFQDDYAAIARSHAAFEVNGMFYDFFLHDLMPKMLMTTVGYISFLLLNQLIVPHLLERRRLLLGVPLIITVLAFFFTFMMVAYSYRLGFRIPEFESTEAFHTYCARRAFSSTILYGAIYVFYYGLKYLYFTYLHSWFTENGVWKKMTIEMMLMLAGWIIWMVMMMQDGRPAALKVLFWTGLNFMVVYAICYYIVFPPFHRREQRWPPVVRNLLLTTLITGIISFFMIAYGSFIPHLEVVTFLTAMGDVFLVLPLAFILSRTRMKEKNEVLKLEKALGRSSANLDFLRSQINPHFLFNALNTLYGTALQENAPRTSEGVQKLGDMMRFMLHENQQEKIELTKEVAYLQNYIALQRLRTMASPDIKIEVNIKEDDCDHFIAPMLLIPFVENAFKHGISLRSRSWIVVSLSCSERYIYFDAYNSVHPKQEYDPEKTSLGIGLNNVKHRLALLYPKKHELNIRETNTEFFVHLTIDTGK